MISLVLALALSAAPPAHSPSLQKALDAYDALDYDRAGQLFDAIFQDLAGLDASDLK